VLLNVIPGPFLNPNFLVVCLLMGVLGLVIYHFSAARGERFRTRTLAFVKSFTLPWFAVLGAHKALEQDLGIFAAVVIGLIATTAGGVMIDLFSGVTPEVVRPAEQLVTTAVIASGIYAALANSGLAFFHVTLIAVLVAFVFRVLAVREHWTGIVPQVTAEPGPVVVAGAAASADRDALDLSRWLARGLSVAGHVFQGGRCLLRRTDRQGQADRAGCDGLGAISRREPCTANRSCDP
jgi:uncharacterized membrane protein YeiH